VGGEYEQARAALVLDVDRDDAPAGDAALRVVDLARGEAVLAGGGARRRPETVRTERDEVVAAVVVEVGDRERRDRSRLGEERPPARLELHRRRRLRRLAWPRGRRRRLHARQVAEVDVVERRLGRAVLGELRVLLGERGGGRLVVALVALAD